MVARLLLLCLGLSTLSACRGQVRDHVRAPLCSTRVPHDLAHLPAGALPASLWYKLLIKGDVEAPGPDAVDCAGEPIAWPAVPESCATSEPAQPLRRGPARDDELLVRHAGGAYWFAWAPLWKLDDGSAQGPLAIAERRGDRLEVRALGTVRGYARQAHIALHPMGASYVLSVEGEHCVHHRGCVRAVRLAVLARQRFDARPLRAASTRACLSPAWFPLRAQHTHRLDDRWQRELGRELALRYDPDAVTIDEHIVVRDRDRAQPALPARLFREAASRIRVRSSHGELLTEGQSLWPAIRAQDASLEPAP